MVVDYVSGSVPEEEYCVDVDEVLLGSICYDCGMMGRFAK